MPLDGVERRLSAILSADVVGYSRLMAEDEDGTVRRLAAYRDEIALLVEQHDGRVVDFTGDNFLAEFPSAINATRCAVEIQGVLKARNASLAEDQRMVFRMGIHLGDVRVEGERIFGDGVNIAARLEALAEPGGLCISGTVHEQVKTKLDLDFADLGKKEVKNILDPVRVFGVGPGGEQPAIVPWSKAGGRWLRRTAAIAVVLLVVIGGWWIWSQREQAGDGRDLEEASSFRRIAALPFDNLTGDPSLDQLAFGIPEEMSTSPVTAYGSILTPRDSTQAGGTGPCELTRGMDVRWVYEGAIVRFEDTLRITAQLTPCPEGDRVWSDSYDVPSQDLLAAQRDVATRILAATQQVINLDSGAPGSLTWYLDQRTKAHNRAGLSYLREAVVDTPEDQALWTSLVQFHLQSLTEGWTESPSQSIQDLLDAAESLVERAPQDWGGHAWAGFAYYFAGDRVKMLASWHRALEINEGVVPASHAMLAVGLSMTGSFEEALESLERAKEQSPVDPAMSQWLWFEACAYFGAERYEEAREAAQRSVEFAANDDFGNLATGYQYLAASLAQLNRAEEAELALIEALKHRPELSLALAGRSFAAADQDFRNRYLEGLRLAGLEE